MKIKSFQLMGIRCFEDSGEIELGSRSNIFVGENNAGKSTLLKGILGFQHMPFSGSDKRPGSVGSIHSITLNEVHQYDRINKNVNSKSPIVRFYNLIGGDNSAITSDDQIHTEKADHGLFFNQSPRNVIVPFLARRKAEGFDQNVAAAAQNEIPGTYRNLYSRIDSIVTAGHPRHEQYLAAIKQIVGLPITTRASSNGKVAGYYRNEETFITLDQMGDGITELVAFIVELCLARNKIFVIEEPETNLHPSGLKALLSMVRESAENNQFIIATHSNIVVRELASEPDTKVFRVFREDLDHLAESKVEEVPDDPAAHITLLRELGYEFTDLALHEGWLFLEESSAEQIIRDILIPNFAPILQDRLRTYSANGVTNLEPSFSEFHRLVTFVHLQPAYQGRLWIRADGDESGDAVVRRLLEKFDTLTENSCASFSQPAFEYYYPEIFQDRVNRVLGIENKRDRREEKAKLLREVVSWTEKNPGQAAEQWQQSASELIQLLRDIESAITS